MEWVWVLIPLTAIIMGNITGWMKMREKQRRLGVSAHEVEREIEGLRAERDQLVERVENLEAIVTSRVWEAARETRAPAAAPAGPSRAELEAAVPPPPAPAGSSGLAREGPSPREKARRLASRMNV